MSHIHFVGGEKGGVGKSVLARVLAQWFIDKAIPFAGIDADRSQAALLRSYGTFTQPADLSSHESADQIVDRALGAERHVLVDLPGQSAHLLHAWLAQADVLNLAHAVGLVLVYWHVIDGGFASVSELERALCFFEGSARHVVVKNLGRGREFYQFEASRGRAHLEDLGGRVIELPELDGAAMYNVDSRGWGFGAAVTTTEGDLALRMLERHRVKFWLERCYSVLSQSVGDLFPR